MFVLNHLVLVGVYNQVYLIQVNVQKTPSSCTQKQHTEAARTFLTTMFIQRRLFCKSTDEKMGGFEGHEYTLCFVHLVSLDLNLADMVARINDDADISCRSKMTFSDTMQEREKIEICCGFSLVGSIIYRIVLSLEVRRSE